MSNFNSSSNSNSNIEVYKWPENFQMIQKELLGMAHQKGLKLLKKREINRGNQVIFNKFCKNTMGNTCNAMAKTSDLLKIVWFIM